MNIIKANIDCIEIAANLFDLYRQFYKQKSDVNSAKEFLTERITSNESVIYLALDEADETEETKNSGMGFVQLYPSFSSVSMKKMWILNDLFVHENYRRQGVAEALIEKSKQLAIETKAKGLVLETHNSNFDAQKLYNKTGFELYDEYFTFYLKI
ncbi:MAG: GNAT family N-acetyltransferase [Ignavibacteria bacterium]|nr:GNAT family N-acetyltransferase [Ignavibacteria bacterium]